MSGRRARSACLTLSPDETNNEALFRTELTNTLLSLNQPVQFNTNEAFSLNISNYFAGTKSLRSLVPQFNGNRYVNNTLPDYTFGGLLVGEPACDTEALLRKLLDRPYAGIYTGSVSDSFYGGAFAAFLGTNLRATIVGYDDDIQSGAFAQFTVDNGGSWSFETNGVSDNGPFIVSSYGSFYNKDGSFYGEFDYFDTNYNYLFSQQLNGDLSSPLGNFQSSAGYYFGSWSGSGPGGGGSGQLYGVLAADGRIYYSSVQSNGKIAGGGMAQLDSTDHFTNTDVSGTVVSGKLDTSNHTMSGAFVSSDISGSWNMSRSASAPFDVPPVITTPPTNKTVPLGTNATFSLVATGSPPMCYQWYFNSNAIPFATTNTLVVSNLQYSSAGTYSVTIDNVVGETNAAVTLTVVPETVPPAVAITNITAGMLVSNASFTVMGTATDNVAVASVYCSLSNAVVNSGFAPATTANNWANWSTNVALTPGTNTVRAYAVDTSGNLSTTNSATVVYILSAPLTVQTNGNGTISPNYNGTLLQIGKSYSMTATAGSGFAFASWTGSITTNGATLQFTMASNLTFTANFVDVTKPTLSITNVTAGMNVSNASFTVKGTAGDNVAVSNVFYSLNNTGWSNAVTGNNWTNWTAAVTLLAGTNTIAAYAVDTSGNLSTTNSLNFVYVVSATLTVSTNGLGSLNPNYNGALLQIGKSYSITATAGTGFAFTNWTGGTNLPLSVITNGTTVQFLMVSNLMLQANFVDVTKPTLSITAPTSGQHLTNALANVRGTASDNWGVTNVWYQLNSNAWSTATSTNGWTNWTVTLTLVAGTNTVKAYAVDLGANLSTTNSVSFVSSNTFQLQLGFAATQPMASNGLNFNLQVSLGLNGRIEVSTNLVNWTTLTNFVGTNATIYFRDAAATNLNLRFYRAVTP